MTRWNLNHRALTASIVAVLLAGCGESQPIGTPGAIPESNARASSSYQVLHSFSRRRHDGETPSASLIEVNGALYGTTYFGGSYTECGIYRGYYNYYFGCGTVFKMSTSGEEHVLHYFQEVSDGVYPAASLIDVNGTFYGTTVNGGKHRCYPTASQNWGCGTVFSITKSGREKVLHSFGRGSDGMYPDASLIDVKGTLYGTTGSGGAHGHGTVFSISTSGTEQVVYSFRGAPDDGGGPDASLIDVKGTLYGTTCGGGTHSGGTVFSITTSGAEKVLHSFGSGGDGVCPAANLIDVKGTLYGTTQVGGVYTCGTQYSGCGTVFSISTSGAEKVLHRFGKERSDGEAPNAGLIDVKGTLYGTTYVGGMYRGGTVFSITTSGAEQVLHSFGDTSHGGYGLVAGLVNVNGTLYGTTVSGGAHGRGIVFALTP